MKKYPFDLERALRGDPLINEEGKDILGFHKRLDRATDDVYPYADTNDQIYTKRGKVFNSSTNAQGLFMKHPPLKESDKILVRDNHCDQWEPRIFITIDSKDRILCVSGFQTKQYEEGNNYEAESWKYYKCIPQIQTYKALVKLNINIEAESEEEATNMIQKTIGEFDIKSIKFKANV